MAVDLKKAVPSDICLCLDGMRVEYRFRDPRSGRSHFSDGLSRDDNGRYNDVVQLHTDIVRNLGQEWRDSEANSKPGNEPKPMTETQKMRQIASFMSYNARDVNERKAKHFLIWAANVIDDMKAKASLPPETADAKTARAEWIPCNGQTLSVAEYPELYECMGIKFGGNTRMFNVPDLRPRPHMDYHPMSPQLAEHHARASIGSIVCGNIRALPPRAPKEQPMPKIADPWDGVIRTPDPDPLDGREMFANVSQGRDIATLHETMDDAEKNIGKIMGLKMTTYRVKLFAVTTVTSYPERLL